MRRRLVRRLVSAVVVATAVTTLAALGLANDAFAGFQRRASDALFPSAERDDRVVVIGMDKGWIGEFGATASRSVHARLADALTAAGVDTIAWDVVFAGARDDDADAQLADALAGVSAPVLAIDVTEFRRGDQGLYRAEELLAPDERLLTGSTSVGHVLVTPDPVDGVVRVLPIVVDDGVNILPSLALQALRASQRDESSVIVRGDGVQVGNRFVPTEGDHLLRLNFAEGLDRGDSPQVIPAVDVLAGRVDPERLRGKIAFVGATEPVFGDSELVPVDKSNTYPGVLVHANALNTMLTSSYLAPVSDTETVLWIALVSLVVALAVFLLPLLYALLVMAAVAVAYLAVTFVRFDDGHSMNIVFGALAIFVTFVASLIVRFFTETRRHRRVSSLFSQYVPQAVARELEESGGVERHVGGERLDVGLFFCDLRGFTSLSATLEPTQVRAMLNAFYELTTDSILQFGGTIMKFVGDEVFAVFGAPLPVPEHAQRALDCARLIQRRAPELREMLAEIDIPEVRFGIGLNAGEVVAAHVGDSRRRQYDVVGDTVNLASRLCGQAGPGEIVLKESLLDQLRDPPPIEIIGPVALKGLDEPVRLVRVVATAEAPA